MLEDEGQSYYDILEVPTDASPQEIREAYLRLKTAYGRDSVALYSLVSPEEKEQTLQQIEEAYQVLSSTEKRHEYDTGHSYLGASPQLQSVSSPKGKIIPLERTPPEEVLGGEEDLLTAPRTDFQETSSALESTASTLPMTPSTPSSSVNSSPPMGAEKELLEQEIQQIIDQQSEWKGGVLRKIREMRRVSIEEMAEFTKITKRYLRAIEEENYQQLPAAVYLRGFIVQIAKKLRLPHEQVATSYLDRYRARHDPED